MKLEDAPQVSSIINNDLGYNVKLNFIENQFIKLNNNLSDNYIYVYEDTQTKEVLGFIHAQKYEVLFEETMLNIQSLAVSRNSQGQGGGKALMKKIEEIAKLENINTIRLNSNVIRKDAHIFYQKLGYESPKEQKVFKKIIK